MKTPTQVEKQADFLAQLTRNIHHKRGSLVGNMRQLARRLNEEAARLEDDPERDPDSLGYVAPTSLSRDVDREAVELKVLMGARRELLQVLVGE